jgi:hypothetical protein
MWWRLFRGLHNDVYNRIILCSFTTTLALSLDSHGHSDNPSGRAYHRDRQPSCLRCTSAMKLANSILNDAISLDQRRTESFTRCAHLFARDRSTQLPAALADRRCVFCKAMSRPSMFRSPDNGATEPLANLLDLPCGICFWHVGSITRVVWSEPGERNGCISQMERMCMLCGARQSWHRCGCICDSCAFQKT